jgi:hypothetical protein
MKHLNGYAACAMFTALRLHFSKGKYDYFRMRGKIRITREGFDRRPDRTFFEMISREYTAEQLRDFFVANLLEDKYYIKEFFYDNADTFYNDYLRRRQSLSYIYTNELGRLFDKGFKVPFAVSHSTYPRIVLLFLRREVSIETMVILDDLLGFTDKFDKYYDDDIIWSKISVKMRKYRPFLKYDRDKMKNILKDVMTK